MINIFADDRLPDIHDRVYMALRTAYAGLFTEPDFARFELLTCNGNRQQANRFSIPLPLRWLCSESVNSREPRLAINIHRVPDWKKSGTLRTFFDSAEHAESDFSMSDPGEGEPKDCDESFESVNYDSAELASLAQQPILILPRFRTPSSRTILILTRFRSSMNRPRPPWRSGWSVIM